METVITIFLPMFACFINLLLVFRYLRQKAQPVIIWMLMLNCVCFLFICWFNVNDNESRQFILVAFVVTALADFLDYHRNRRNTVSNPTPTK
jgi:hypothetical protein